MALRQALNDLWRTKTEPPKDDHFKLTDIEATEQAKVVPMLTVEQIEHEYSKLQAISVDLQCDFARLEDARKKLRDDFEAQLKQLDAEYTEEYAELVEQARKVASRMEHLQSLVIERAKNLDLRLDARGSHGLPIPEKEAE